MRSAGGDAVIVVAVILLGIFGIGWATVMWFAIRLLWHMLDINVRAHQEIRLLAARRRAQR